MMWPFRSHKGHSERKKQSAPLHQQQQHCHFCTSFESERAHETNNAPFSLLITTGGSDTGTDVSILNG